MGHRNRSLQQIAEQNDLKAYQADPSGFLWAVLEVLRHGDHFTEPDFQALIERGRMAAAGQGGMMDHSEDIRQADEAERQRAFEESEPGVGPPRPVMPGEGSTVAEEMERAVDPRVREAQEHQAEAERQGITAPTAAPATQEALEDAEEGEEAEGDDDDEGAEEEEAGDDDAESTARAEAEVAARERGLVIRDTAAGWRVFDPRTNRMVSRTRLEEPVKAGAA